MEGGGRREEGGGGRDGGRMQGRREIENERGREGREGGNDHTL